MLEEIRKIVDAPFISFEQYFTNYVISVQDNNIDSEISFILRHNFLNVNSMIRLSSEIDKELKTLC